MGTINIYQAGRLLDQYDNGNYWGNGGDNGRLNKHEFKNMFRDIFGRGDLGEAGANFGIADTNDDGQVDRNELRNFLNRIQEGDTKLGRNSRNDMKDLLKKLLEMMGVNLDGTESLEDLKDILEDLNNGGMGNCKPKPYNGNNGGWCPPPQCGGGPKPQCGGGSTPSSTPTTSSGNSDSPPVNDDAGGGNKNDLVITRGELKAVMNQAEGSNDKLSRSEAEKVFNYMDAKAEQAGSQSFLSQSERDKIFDRFDKNGDGQLGTNEQKQFRDYMMNGIAPLDNKMRIMGWDRINSEN